MRLRPGEVPATGWRVETLSDVLQRLRSAAPDVAGRPLLVAIDGRGGAGKSTLVERLRGSSPLPGSCTPTTSPGTTRASTGET
jgi:guanylate kinase